MKTHPFREFFRKIWAWNILLDIVLMSLAAFLLYKILTDKTWDTTGSVQQFQWLIALQTVHSGCLFIYAVTRLWQRKFGSGVILFLHAAVLLILTGLLTSILLMAGMR